MSENIETTFAAKDYSTVNFEAVTDITNEWTSTIGEFSTQPKMAEEPVLIALQKIELANNFHTNYDKGIEEIITSIQTTIAETNKYMEDLLATEGSLAGLMPKRDNPGGGDRPADTDTPGGGDTPGGDAPPTDEVADTEPVVPTPTDPITQNTPLDVKTITKNDLNKVMDLFFAMSQDQKISNNLLEMGDKFKEELLKLDLSKEFRESLEKSGNTFMAQLMDLVNKEDERFKMNSDSTAILKEFMETLVIKNMDSGQNADKSKNIKDEVISSLNNVMNFMKTTLNSVDRTTGKAPVENFLSVYDGAWGKDNLNANDVTLVRTIFNFLGQKKNLPVEELFVGESNVNEIQNVVNDLNKGNEFLSIIKNLKDEDFQKKTYDVMNSVYTQTAKYVPGGN